MKRNQERLRRGGTRPLVGASWALLALVWACDEGDRASDDQASEQASGGAVASDDGVASGGLASDPDTDDATDNEQSGSGGERETAGATAAMDVGDGSSAGEAADDSPAAGEEEAAAQLGACAEDAATAAHEAEVVEAASAFLSALTVEQREVASVAHTVELATRWSNYPSFLVRRNGLGIGEMSEAGRAAALALVEVAAGELGADFLAEIRAADEHLHTEPENPMGQQFGQALYFFSVHGEPSTEAPWMFQVGGHHIAYNFAYGSPCVGATPQFDASEPMDWTDDDGATHSPLEAQRDSMVALISAVQDMAGAELSGTFTDLVNGPANLFEFIEMGSDVAAYEGDGLGDAKYPNDIYYPDDDEDRGAPVSEFRAEQRELVKAAIEAWVEHTALPVTENLLASYESDEALDQTFVAYSGSPDLSTETSYARIDGPRVWIEVSVQPGIVYPDEVHFHTLWRDKVGDYGAEFGAE